MRGGGGGGGWSGFWRKHHVGSNKNNNASGWTVDRDDEGTGLIIQKGGAGYLQNIRKFCLGRLLALMLLTSPLFWRYGSLVGTHVWVPLARWTFFLSITVLGGEGLSRLASAVVTINDSEISVRGSLFSRSYKVQDMDVIRRTNSFLHAVDRQTKQRNVFLLGPQLREAESIIYQIKNHPGLKQIQSKLVDDCSDKKSDIGGLAVQAIAAIPYVAMIVFSAAFLVETQTSNSTNSLSRFLAFPNLVEFRPTDPGYRAFEERYPEAAILTYFPSSSSSTNADLAQSWEQVSQTCQTTISQESNLSSSIDDCRNFGFAIVNCEKYPTWWNCQKCDAKSNPCMLTRGRIRGQSLSQFQFQITATKGFKNIEDYMQDKRDYVVNNRLAVEMSSLHQVLSLQFGFQDLDSMYASSAVLLYYPQNTYSKTLAMKWNALAAQCQRQPQSCTKSYFGFAFREWHGIFAIIHTEVQ